MTLGHRTKKYALLVPFRTFVRHRRRRMGDFPGREIAVSRNRPFRTVSLRDEFDERTRDAITFRTTFPISRARA